MSYTLLAVINILRGSGIILQATFFAKVWMWWSTCWGTLSSSIVLSIIVDHLGMNFQSVILLYSFFCTYIILSLWSFIWDKTKCSLVDIYQQLRGTFCLLLWRRKLGHVRKRSHWWKGGQGTRQVVNHLHWCNFLVC
jgi:hypothetical protein